MHRPCLTRLAILICGAFTILASIPDTARALDPVRYCVVDVSSSNGLSVHKAPGAKTLRLGTIKSGACGLRYMGLETRDGRWVLVNYRGLEGWIRVRHLKAAGTLRPPQRPATTNFRVVGVASWDKLNVRSRPNSNARLRGTLTSGAACIALTGKCRSGWCPIRYRNVSGWVNARFLVRDDSAQQCGSG